MNSLRSVVSELFQSPMQDMSFVSYVSYVNTAGKITPRTLMDLLTISLTYIDEQEKKNQQYEQNFKEIEEILVKLANQKVSESTKLPVEISESAAGGNGFTGHPSTSAAGSGLVATTTQTPTISTFKCDQCERVFDKPFGLEVHKRSHKVEEK